MKYTKIQQSISSFIIFSLLFGTTFRVPFFNFSTYAGSSDFFNLVSIIIDEESYNEVSSEINRYATDIQGVLENTKVIILPTPKNTKAFNIASLNESLYNEGYKSIDDSVNFESKLIGTVLVGDFNLPIVYNGNESSQTILPFTDFEDKSFIYNHENNRYEINEKNASKIKSEIWHGVISPNLGSFDDNIQGLKDYFNKNHDYYSGTGNFKFSEGVLNGNNIEGISSDYEPYIFYNDQIREEKSLSYNSFQSYEAYIENLEDITYNRFTGELSDKVTGKALGKANESIINKASDIVKLNEELDNNSPFGGFDSNFVSKLVSSGPDISKIPDIQTRQIIENATKNFIEIFSKGTFGEFRKEIHNAGRYNENQSKINMDLIPYLISVLDVVNPHIIKQASNDLEDKIDKIVKTKLQKNIYIPVEVKEYRNDLYNKVYNSGNNKSYYVKNHIATYKNFLYGNQVSHKISQANDCSIYRGSTFNGGQLVEANRMNNIQVIQNDINILKAESLSCISPLANGDTSVLEGYWGKNSPLNLDFTSGGLASKSHNVLNPILPIFDIGGSREVISKTISYPDVPVLKNSNSYLDCAENNFITHSKWTYYDVGDGSSGFNRTKIFQLPLKDNGDININQDIAWNCSTQSDRKFNYTKSYEQLLNETRDIQDPNNHSNTITVPKCSDLVCVDGSYEITFKAISTDVIHKSPTEEELKTQINNMVTPNLPIDKDRFIDFKNSSGNYQKINYPYLFRLGIESSEELTFENIEKALKDTLDIYDPVLGESLYSFLKNKIGEIIPGISSTYYDALVFSIFWTNLNSVSAKYAFVFDYFLNDQSEIGDQKYFLPGNKKQYEIAYLGARGDTENMYIKMDPEGKADNVYADIISDNINLSSSLLGSNIGPLDDSEDEEALFKCAPPDGVPIWEWLPAVMCRLGEMLPPTISFGASECSGSTVMYLSDEDENITSWSDSEEYTCEGDSDNNGINDCVEQGLLDGGVVELKTDGYKYYYNSNANLSVNIKDNDGKIVRDINGTYIYFELQKIEEKGGNIVYDIFDDNINNESIISSYVNFNNGKLRLSNGSANYNIGTKNKEVDIYLKAIIKQTNEYGTEENFIESDELKIEVRGDRLFSSSYKLKNTESGLEIDSGTNSLKVSDKDNIILVDGTEKNIEDISASVNKLSTSDEKLVIFVDNLSVSGESLPISYPLDVTILEGGREIDKYIITKNNLNIFKSLGAIQKSGSYTIEITDNDGFKTKKNIELLPDTPSYIDLNLGTTIMQTGGNISTNFIAIYDEYSNITSGTFYDINIVIDGDGVKLVGDDSENITTSTYEGYKIFRLKSLDEEGSNEINITIFDQSGNEIISSSKSVETIEEVKLFVRPLSGDIKVGGGTYKYEVSLRNTSGEILTGFNSRVYLTSNPIFLSPVKTYVVLENGIAEIEFRTNTVAGKNIPIEFQVEGLTEIIEKEITIYPESPIKIDLVLLKNKIEANTEDYSVLNVELKDRYNNLVFNDSSTNTKIEILDQFSHIISSDKTSSTVSEGKTSYNIYSTNIPGVAYFKISTNTSLQVNSFIVEDENGSITINGVGENAGKIETFYFWNKEKIENKKYNSIYTTLLGSNYGDISQKNYLAGSLLFEGGNRALSVTSLITNPYKYANILKLDKSGLLNVINSGQDLSQDIEINTKYLDNKIAFDIYNKSLNIYVGEVFYNFDDDTKLVACETTHKECTSETETSISLKSYSSEYSVITENNKLVLNDLNGESVLEIEEDGTISRTGFVELEYDKLNNTDILLINIKKNGIVIAKMGFNFVDSITNISRDINIFNSKINSLSNSILIFIRTNSYGTYDYGDIDNKAKIIYYNDPFASENTLNSFSKSNLYGYENFINDGGIGWKDGNKSLLAFSAGKTVGESVQDYMSFGVINLGDPVISLKKIKKQLPNTTLDRKFDATIGKLLSTDENISAYHIFDYDNDEINDILLIKNDKYFKLLENKDVEGRFIDKGNLALITDIGDLKSVGTGDFTGDSYEDIFFVNKNGEPFMLNNVNKNFIRYSLIENFDLSGAIIVAEVFDMDNDGISDIVTLDDFGEINIFYGGGTSINPNFTKLTLSTNNGINLNPTPRNDNSLVYFDGLYQPSEEPSDNDRMDNLLFIKYPYENETQTITYEGILSGEQSVTDEKPSKYFLKTEYTKGLGILVEKTYIDVNGGTLASSDIIEANITITNDSDSIIDNIIFAEKVPSAFYLDKKTIIGSLDVDINNGMMGYQFVIDNFYLEPGESITITYESKVRPLKHSYIDVGLFEHNEIGDDLFGDVIVKKDNKNCGDTIGIFRSLQKRSYEKGIKTPTCDDEKVELPEEFIDTNGDGVPDYIEELINSGNTEATEKYANEQLNKFNGDNEDVGSVIDELTTSLEDVNNYIEGLTCGFGADGCIATPLNRAPLAPGNDPVFMGELIGDGLNIDEGLPVFSAITGMYYGPVWGPSVWPISPLGYDTQDLGAGGRLGTDSFTNFIRIFVTPTLTGAVGTAICFGGSADVMGQSIPEGVSPLTPGGNCIVLTESMDFCGGDGSDGDPESIGTPTYVTDGNGADAGFGIINGNCGGATEAELELDTDIAEDYLKNVFGGENYSFNEDMFGESDMESLFTDEGGLGLEVSLNLDAGDDGDFSDILQIDMTRITSFPSWLMDWVTRQIEEIANKLTDFPTIFIILPDFTGILDLKWGEDVDHEVPSDSNEYVKKANTGIKEAYEFIGSMPLVYIEQEPVDIVIPWISEPEINKLLTSYKATWDQRMGEIERAKNEWTLGNACDYADVSSQKACEEENALAQRVSLEFIANFDSLINSLEVNIDTLNEYKKFPEKINKLINIKETYLEQILCNIESISNILGGRIGKNGERFQAWVETYILIKAILKSWQGLIDVFVDYEEECHDCKNERQDGLESEFSLIGAIVPSIPVIRFPKWPDVILDLHNIRAGLRIPLPQFNINTKPIILPTLPNLYLPTVPSISLSADITLPEIPLLPPLEIPELPDLPSLPSVELPDLPPPPNLPEIMSEISVVVEIIDLIAQAMCVLKSSPFVPEWRAGDQIAFLTERGGYLSSDFIEASFPEFSFPSVDSIKVSTYVNLEFETDFIIELAKQIVQPLNNFSNDFTNIFDIKIADLDFRSFTPESIDYDIEIDLSEESWLNKSDIFKNILASKVTTDLLHLSSVIDEGKNDTVSSKEFKKLINKSLASKNITSNPKLDDVIKIWEQVNSHIYSKEKELIEDLKENNREKFRVVSDIINTEIINNKKLKKKINNIGIGPVINKVAYQETNNTELYNQTLEIYNNKFKHSAKNLINYDSNDNNELKESRDLLLSKIKTPLQKYSKNITKKTTSKLLADSAGNPSTPVNSITTCQQQANNSSYKYEYEGIYIIEENKTYRLFDYLDELDGDEIITPIDIDNDGDMDILYFTKGQLFFKENLETINFPVFVTTNPIVINANNNKFYNNNIYYEAINNVKEAGDSNSRINLAFSSPTNSQVNNFRIGLYTIVDKYLNENNSNYRPKNINKDIIDAVAGIDKISIIEESYLYTKRKNLVYINAVGDLRNTKLITKELLNIGTDLLGNQVVNISAGTFIYAGGNTFTIDYIEKDDDKKEEKSLSVSANENIELQKSIKIIGLSGNAFVEGQKDIILEATEINNYLDLPLFPGTIINYDGNINSGNPSYIELTYYDDSELSLDFSETKKWELYDLGGISSDYFVGLSKENKYYYTKINSFKDNIDGTLSKQILLAPQIESDKTSPDLSLNNIRIPIYQKHTEDITDYIYEYSGIKNISKVIVDLDLETDTDGNGKKTDDNDLDQLTVEKSLISIKLKFREFEELFKKKIGITLIDSNNNSGYKEVTLEVYTPTPKITDYGNGLIEGSINESLTGEPIDLYRYRGGSLIKLEDIDGLLKTNTDNGNYSFYVGSDSTGLTLYKNGSIVATINETTGKISLTDYSLSTKVLSSNNEFNDGPFPKISIEKNDEEIFYEYLQVTGTNNVSLIEDFENITERGIYFRLTDKVNYNYYTIPETLDYAPGSLSVYRITDTTKVALFTLFNDGRVNTLNYNYKLEYDSYNDYVVFKIIDLHFDREIGRVIFVIDGEYIMK